MLLRSLFLPDLKRGKMQAHAILVEFTSFIPLNQLTKRTFVLSVRRFLSNTEWSLQETFSILKID